MSETRYLRYVATNSIRKVLEPLESDSVIRLDARRSFAQQTGSSQPLQYLNVHLREATDVDVGYLSVNGYRFSKKGLFDFIDSADGLIDLPVQAMDLLIGKSPIGAAFAELRSDQSLKSLPWVAMFEEFPLRREPEENEYTEFVRSRFQLDGLGKIGFEPASLDLTNILPLNVWKQVVRFRLSRDLRDQIESWAAMLQEVKTSAVRNLALGMFPKEICRGRQYERLKGDVWRLVRHGDI